MHLQTMIFAIPMECAASTFLQPWSVHILQDIYICMVMKSSEIYLNIYSAKSHGIHQFLHEGSMLNLSNHIIAIYKLYTVAISIS